MLKLAPDVERDQAAADALLDQLTDAVMRSVGRDGMYDQGKARANLVPLVAAIRADERDACLDVMRNFDRTGREWVPGSLWSNVFTDAIKRIEARGN